MNIRNIIALAICIAIPLITGGIASLVTSSNIESWHAYLEKPVFNPPNWLFGPVWTTLYILMGISLFIIWKKPDSAQRKSALRLFFVQLLLNFAWSFIFFYFHQTGFAFLEIIVLWIAILLMIFSFHRLNRWAAYLQFPYLGWVTFASVLNGSIWYLNRS